MKYSELEKMDHMEALLMLYRKIREVRPTADAMSCLVVEPDMDQEMANVSLAFMAETFAMQVMQEELDETPVDEELGKLYEIAKYVREEAVGLLGSCFMLQRQLAPDAHEMLETEDNGRLTDREAVLMEDLCKAVVDAGFMDPEKERLFAAICDEGTDRLTPVGRHIIDPEDEGSELVFAHLECLESLMQQYKHIGKTQYLVLSVGSKEDEDIEGEDLPLVFERSFFPDEGGCGSCTGEDCLRIGVGDGCHWKRDDVLFAENMEPGDMSDAKVMLMILRMMDGIVDGRKLFEEGDKLLVGYSKDFAGAGKKTVINFCGQSGNGITILK